jgi:1-deoxy-D-xylulose-5-phosphate reductoisomerase
MSQMRKTVSILGATGSIGQSTADVITEVRAAGGEIEVEAITGGRNLDALVATAARLRPRFVAIADESLLAAARARLPGIEVGAGEGALLEAAARPADWVMSAIVGAAGMRPTLEAIARGADVALANKESLVCAGPLMLAAAKHANARLIPVDSEHNAIFQVLGDIAHVEKIIITASGGPFLRKSLKEMEAATPEEALKHPKWNMGPKISIDSATLFNKGLELIEASHLFALAPERIEVLVHPESIIHSMVAYRDGSVLAQLGEPDMRTPISVALAWPERVTTSVPALDLAARGALTFEAPDLARFPALGLCRAAFAEGAGATAILNAANETAVEAFLQRRIGFLDIARIVESVLSLLAANKLGEIAKSPSSFDEVIFADAAGRQAARAAALRLQAA